MLYIIGKKSWAFIPFVGWKIFPEIKGVTLNLELVHFLDTCLFEKLGSAEHDSPGGALDSPSGRMVNKLEISTTNKEKKWHLGPVCLKLHLTD